MKSKEMNKIIHENTDIIITKISKRKGDEFALAKSSIGNLFIYDAKYTFRELKETNIPIHVYNSIPDGRIKIIFIWNAKPYLVNIEDIITKPRINRKLKLAIFPVQLSRLKLLKKQEQPKNQTKFIHTHVHTDHSLIDGISTCISYVNKAKNLGMPAIAITDHGNISAHLYLQLEAEKLGIKPIFGVEAYVVQDATIHDSDHRSNNHIVLLAKNKTGYKNILTLQKLSWSPENFYYRPRIGYKTLKKYHKGLIALTACIKGLMGLDILNGELSVAYRTAKWLKKVFGDDLYLEIQLHNIFDNQGNDLQKIYNKELIKMSRKLDIELVLTNDVHYADKGMHKVQEKVIKMKSDSDLADAYCRSIWFKSLKELTETRKNECSYIKIPTFKKAVSNTLKIADKCNYKIPTGGLRIPSIDISEFPGHKSWMTEEDYLTHRIKKGIRKRVKENKKKLTSEYSERIKIEMNAFIKMKVISYILIYDDLVRFLKKKGCLCSLRGSANGSIVLWLIGLSIVDPIKFNILFERFISPARIEAEMADIDIDLDISHEYRDVAINYLKEKYGEDHICIVGTFGRTQLKASVKNMARVEAIKIKKRIDKTRTKTKIKKLEKKLEQFSYKEINKVTKLMPLEFDKLKDSSVSDWYKKNKKWLKKYIKPILGNVYSESLHPAGIVISPEPYHEWLPVRTNKLSQAKGGHRVFATQWENSHTSVEHLNERGVMVMDILGVKTLTIVDETLKLIKKRHGEKLKLEAIPLNNRKTYKTLSKGENLGIFQLSEGFLKPILRQTKPDNIEDIIFMVAADRPGPMASGAFDHYAKRKHGKEKVKVPHPSMKIVLKDTLGVLTYSEHVMRTATFFAGMDPIDSEKMRKVVKSKNPADFIKFKEKFISGAIKKWTKK